GNGVWDAVGVVQHFHWCCELCDRDLAGDLWQRKPQVEVAAKRREAEEDQSCKKHAESAMRHCRNSVITNVLRQLRGLECSTVFTRRSTWRWRRCGSSPSGRVAGSATRSARSPTGRCRAGLPHR